MAELTEQQLEQQIQQMKADLESMLESFKGSFLGLLGFSEEDLIKEILMRKFKEMMPLNIEGLDDEEEIEEAEDDYEEKIEGMITEAVSSGCSEFVNSIKADLNELGILIKTLPTDITNLIGTVTGIGTTSAIMTSAPAAIPLLFNLITQISDLINKIMKIISLILKLGLPLFMPILSLLIPLIELLKSLQRQAEETEVTYEDPDTGEEVTVRIGDSVDSSATLESVMEQLQELMPEEPEPEPEPEPQPQQPDMSLGNYCASIIVLGNGEDTVVPFFNSNYISNLRVLNIDGYNMALSSGQAFSDYNQHRVVLVFYFPNNIIPDDLFEYVQANSMNISSNIGSGIILASSGPSNIGSLSLPNNLNYIGSGSILNTSATRLTLQGPPPILDSENELDNLDTIIIPYQYRLLYQTNETWANALREMNLNRTVLLSDGTRWSDLEGLGGGSGLDVREVEEGTYPILSIVQPGTAGYNDSVNIDFGTGQISASSFSGSGEFLTGVAKKEVYTNQELQPDNDICEWVIEHNLGTEDVVCKIKDTETKKEISCEIEYTSENIVKVRINSIFPILEGTYKAVIIG